MSDLRTRATAGIGRLEMLADPAARGFHERQGARQLGVVPSDALPGGRLPLLELTLA